MNSNLNLCRIRVNGIGGFNVMMHAVYSVPVEFGVWSLWRSGASLLLFWGGGMTRFFFLFSPSVARRASGKVTVPYGNVEITYARAEMKAK
jgi:hypothetical protein